MKRAALLAAVLLLAAAARAGGALLPVLAPAGATDYLPGPLHAATNAADRASLTNALPAPRRAAAGALLFDARPAVPAACGLAADALVVPRGDWSLASNRFVHADAAACRALLWRMRRGVSPPRPPVTLGHGGPAVGYLETGWCDARGLVARVRFADAQAATNALALRLSPEMLCAASVSSYGDRCEIPLRLRAVALVADPAMPTRWVSRLFRDDDAPPVPSARTD